MKVAILSNPIVVDEATNLFPNTSFPEGKLTVEFLSENNAKQVSMTKDYDFLTEKLEACDPYEEGELVYIAHSVKLTDEEISTWKYSAWTNMQRERNELLAMCDWTQLPDSPLSSEKKSEWAQYRQSLRDITTQNIDPRVERVVWPAKPE